MKMMKLILSAYRLGFVIGLRKKEYQAPAPSSGVKHDSTYTLKRTCAQVQNRGRSNHVPFRKFLLQQAVFTTDVFICDSIFRSFFAAMMNLYLNQR